MFELKEPRSVPRKVSPETQAREPGCLNSHAGGTQAFMKQAMARNRVSTADCKLRKS